jgi:YebC/PmpR family DNA-binding regulatory protein
MSKHSKWSKVKYQKAVTDVKKAAVYTKMARLITVATREGGGDPNFNFRLRSAIDAALAANLPKDNIERAIKRGTGEEGGDVTESVLYEGYGPGGVGILVEALTDNRNRTSGTIKHAFSSNGGTMAGSGSVQWMFGRHGFIRLGVASLSDETQLAIIDAGASDLSETDEGIEVRCAPESLGKVRGSIEALGLKVEEAGFAWSPKERKEVDQVTGEALGELVAALEDDEDVNEVFTTAD